LHGNQNAARLNQQSYLLSEFLAEKIPGYQPPPVKGKAIVHGHCHHKSVLKFKEEVDLLKKTGLDVQVLDSGCCGMAGAFGYEKEHYDVSLACGERVLLPAVRSAGADTLILTDGFSCREQIQQETNRTPLHFAQLLQLGLHEGSSLPPDLTEVETRYAIEPKTATVPWTVAAFAGALAAGAWMWGRSRR